MIGQAPNGERAVKNKPKRYFRRQYGPDERKALRDRLVYEAMESLGWHPDELSAALEISRVHVYRTAGAHRNFPTEIGERAILHG
jgi:transcriptional regulator of acetoin/glycerol metabolism